MYITCHYYAHLLLHFKPHLLEFKYHSKDLYIILFTIIGWVRPGTISSWTRDSDAKTHVKDQNEETPHVQKKQSSREASHLLQTTRAKDKSEERGLRSNHSAPRSTPPTFRPPAPTAALGFHQGPDRRAARNQADRRP